MLNWLINLIPVQYRLAAIAGSVALSFTTGFGTAWYLFNQADLVKTQQAEIIVLKANAAAQAGELKQRVEDDATLETYRQKYEELRQSLNHPDTVCFDQHDSQRLRDLWDK